MLVAQVTLHDEATRCAELLFSPSSSIAGKIDVRLGSTGIHQATLAALGSVHSDVQRMLRNNVLLAGGSTCLPGLADRLQFELDTILSPGAASVHMFAPDYRNTAEWMGGSVVAHMFAESCHACEFVTKDEWFEWGPNICFRKFLD